MNNLETSDPRQEKAGQRDTAVFGMASDQFPADSQWMTCMIQLDGGVWEIVREGVLGDSFLDQ